MAAGAGVPGPTAKGPRTAQGGAKRRNGPQPPAARRARDAPGAGCSGRCCAPTPLRCSPRGRAAQLASLAALASLRHSAASQKYEARFARRPRDCAARRRRRHPVRPGRAALPAAAAHFAAWRRPARCAAPWRLAQARPPRRPFAAACLEGKVGGTPGEDGAVPREHRYGDHEGAGRGAGAGLAQARWPARRWPCRPQARLVRSREAQRHRRRAQRASSIILAATVRAELAQRAQRVSPRQPVLRASQGTPA